MTKPEPLKPMTRSGYIGLIALLFICMAMTLFPEAFPTKYTPRPNRIRATVIDITQTTQLSFSSIPDVFTHKDVFQVTYAYEHDVPIAPIQTFPLDEPLPFQVGSQVTIAYGNAYNGDPIVLNTDPFDRENLASTALKVSCVTAVIPLILYGFKEMIRLELRSGKKKKTDQATQA